MYNYGAAPYGNQPPPVYAGGFPGQAAPPGMAPPPGVAAPGTAPPPSMDQASVQQANRQPGFPPNFQPPQNMPNINFSAPVIRLGTTGPGPRAQGSEPSRRDSERGGRMGLGASDHRPNQQAALIPPTKDEVVRTIFVGGITEGAGGDSGIERILRCAGNLRRWTRAMDADDKPCRFGFAEYEDPDCLATAVDVLQDVKVPVKPQLPDKDEAARDEVEKSALLIVIDEGTLDYIEQAQAARGDQDPIQKQLRLDAAKGALAATLADLTNPSVPVQQSDLSKVDHEGDTKMATDANGDGEVVTIPLTAVDDELSDIPAEMRETVAKEIAAFRDRSNRRDLERLRREEEAEAMDRRQGFGRPRTSRLASPPASSQSNTGLNGASGNSRDRQPPNAPAGPKGFTAGSKGVSFVNGTGLHGAGGGWIDREDDDTDASDDELERRKQAKKDEEEEKRYLDQERKWLNRERSRTAALERERNRDKDEDSRAGTAKQAVAKTLAEWDDDLEAKRSGEEYYVDRSQWIRNRAQLRAREANLDDMDRAAEERERQREQQQQKQAIGMADDFLNRQAAELDEKETAANLAPREPQRFKLSLGAAAQQKAQAAASSNKRTVADVEGLLEDEEDEGATSKRTLVPIKFDSAAEAAGLTDEERAQAVRQLAAEIPTDKGGLWAWEVKWEFVDESVLSEQLRPFVEKKIVEYLGVQEQMVVEAVEEHVRKRGGPGELVELLEGPLDEEAEVLVKKLWRMIIFFSESEKRGLST